MLRHAVIASGLVLTAACACQASSPPPTNPEPGPTEPGPTEPGPTEPIIDVAQFGTPCAADKSCPASQSCGADNYCYVRLNTCGSDNLCYQEAFHSVRPGFTIGQRTNDQQIEIMDFVTSWQP